MGLLDYANIQPNYPQAFGLLSHAPMGQMGGMGGPHVGISPLPTGQPQGGQAQGLLGQMGPQGLQGLLGALKGMGGASDGGMGYFKYMGGTPITSMGVGMQGMSLGDLLAGGMIPL